jgi:hypothetical protein
MMPEITPERRAHIIRCLDDMATMRMINCGRKAADEKPRKANYRRRTTARRVPRVTAVAIMGGVINARWKGWDGAIRASTKLREPSIFLKHLRQASGVGAWSGSAVVA